MHGRTLTDDYFWLRDKTNPQVIDYLKAEDAYAEAVMKPTAALQDALYKEILGHIKQTDEPSRIARATISTIRGHAKDSNIRSTAGNTGQLTAAEEVILDQNELAKGHPFLSRRRTCRER